MCGALAANAALDTYALCQDVKVLDVSATALEKTDLLLLGPSSATNGESSAGSAIDCSAYEGYGLVVVGQGARSGAGHTSTVTVAYGFDESPATTLMVATQTTASAKFTSYEFDFDTLQGTNDALYLKATLANVAGDDTAMTGDAVLIYDAPRTDLQTITGPAVDTMDFKGYGTIVVSIGAPLTGSTNFSGIVYIQRAAASTGTWATVTNTTGTVAHSGNAAAAITRLPYEFGVGGRYIRAVFTTTNDAAGACVIINSFK